MNISYVISPPLENTVLNTLSSSAWGKTNTTDFQKQLEQALCYVAAFDQTRLVGFVKLVGDAGVHAFLLDTTVHPAYQHQGIGKALVARAVQHAKAHGVEWVHVDYEAHLEPFYQACGFQATKAGLLRVKE
jgi:GNAT superfamily N-acetyltransferase